MQPPTRPAWVGFRVVVRTVRLDGRRAKPDEYATKHGAAVGEVVVRPPKSGFAYLGGSGQETEKLHDGWLYIGDLATWDEQEYVTIGGRKDDMLISGGENVHPVQVEEVLNWHPAVADSLVVQGQLVVAYVVRADPELSVAELRSLRRPPDAREL